MKNVFKLVLYLRNAIKIFVILFRDKIKKIYRKSIKHRNKKLTNKYVIISLGSFILVLFPFDSTEKNIHSHVHIYSNSLSDDKTDHNNFVFSLMLLSKANKNKSSTKQEQKLLGRKLQLSSYNDNSRQ